MFSLGRPAWIGLAVLLVATVFEESLLPLSLPGRRFLWACFQI
jgi:hypothetical protein